MRVDRLRQQHGFLPPEYYREYREDQRSTTNGPTHIAMNQNLHATSDELIAFFEMGYQVHVLLVVLAEVFRDITGI